eukprot:9492182-Pyramimonas_sp.AAC.2
MLKQSAGRDTSAPRVAVASCCFAVSWTSRSGVGVRVGSHFFARIIEIVCKQSQGELNSPVVEWLDKGLTAVWSPTSMSPCSVMDARPGKGASSNPTSRRPPLCTNSALHKEGHQPRRGYVHHHVEVRRQVHAVALHRRGVSTPGAWAAPQIDKLERHVRVGTSHRRSAVRRLEHHRHNDSAKSRPRRRLGGDAGERRGRDQRDVDARGSANGHGHARVEALAGDGDERAPLGGSAAGRDGS